WRHGEFTKLLTRMSPYAGIDDQMLSLATVPRSVARSFSTPILALYFLPTADSADEDLAFPYGDPYPSTWPITVLTQLDASTQINLIDGGAAAAPPQASYYCTWNASALAPGAALEPTIGPVEGFQVNGASGFDGVRGMTTTPTLRWSPP